MYYLNTLPPSYQYLIRKINFLFKLKITENNLLKSLFDIFGSTEIDKMFKNLDKCNVANVNHFRQSIWSNFADSLG